MIKGNPSQKPWRGLSRWIPQRGQTVGFVGAGLAHTEQVIDAELEARFLELAQRMADLADDMAHPRVFVNPQQLRMLLATKHRKRARWTGRRWAKANLISARRRSR